MRCITAPPSMNPIGFASFGSTTSTISVADADGGFGGAASGAETISALAAIVQKGRSLSAQLFGKVVFVQRLQQRDGRAERADERRALGASAEMLLEIAANIGGQPAVEVIGKQARRCGGSRASL